MTAVQKRRQATIDQNRKDGSLILTVIGVKEVDEAVEEQQPAVKG
jgi:vacuolar-type H+-ATPase subunit B/Vma2